MSRKLLEHPIVPIIAGAFVVWDAPGDIKVRSYALVFLFVWLAWDVWRFLTDNENEWYRQNRSVLFSVACCMTAVAMMGVMYWLLDLKLEEQQKETFAKLAVQIYMPPSGDALQSEITMTNGGSYIIAKHDILCGISGVDFTFARKEDLDAYEKIPENLRPPLGGISGISFRTVHSSSEPLKPFGDSRTDICAPAFKIDTSKLRVSCADVTIRVNYSLETQPEINKTKEFRFVAREVGGGFMWHGQPVESKISFCRISSLQF